MTARGDRGRASPIEVILGSVAAVGWALVGMTATAALGLRLLGADTVGDLGPMTAAVVVLAVGGSVTPRGDVSAYGLEGAAARTAVDFTPLGVALVGASILGFLLLRSLRHRGPYIPVAELTFRVVVLTAVFLAAVGGLAWAGHDVVTIDGTAWGTGTPPGGDGGLRVPGLGDVGGLLPDRLGDLVDAKASVGFSVDTAESLTGAARWVLAVVLLALLCSRRAPLPPGRFSDALRRTVRPAASALAAAGLVTLAAGYAAAGYAAAGDDHPRRVLGAALLGAPNGVGVGVPLGLFVPWSGAVRGSAAKGLPGPLDALLGSGGPSVSRPVTVARLAELDGTVWLLAVAAGAMMLSAGVLAASRTPRGGLGRWAFAGRCGARLAVVTAPALLVVVLWSGVSVDASLSVLGIDAFDTGVELHGNPSAALVLGALWGGVAGAVGALVAGGRSVPGRGDPGAPLPGAPLPGPYVPSRPYVPPGGERNPYTDGEDGGDGHGGGGEGHGLHAAPTVAGPIRFPGRGQGRDGRPRGGARSGGGPGPGEGPRRGRDFGPVVPPPPTPPPHPPDRPGHRSGPAPPDGRPGGG
ncbi:streptophobe family protein [Streptomyces sp. NBC_01216]|uniref:streptophobe family protein n=1 Tax=unclassified Streptomyces TaxID=2593676 RepID=UPI002E0F2361|nr:streptophobe family protein [Streptomyces sp. NBC_01216]